MPSTTRHSCNGIKTPSHCVGGLGQLSEAPRQVSGARESGVIYSSAIRPPAIFADSQAYIPWRAK